MTGHQERTTAASSGNLKSDTAEPAHYFQSLFGSSGADHYDWSPLHTYPSGVVLFRQNEPAKQIYFIERGIVKVSSLGPGGREVIISLRRRNWLLGVTQVIADNVYSATATTLTSCLMRSVSAKAFMDQLTTDIALSVELNRVLSREVRRNIETIISLECMPAAERLKRFLSELISEEDHDDLLRKGRLELPLKNAELAEIVAVTPQHLCRILRDPELKAHLKQSKRILTIADPLTFAHKNLS